MMLSEYLCCNGITKKLQKNYKFSKKYAKVYLQFRKECINISYLIVNTAIYYFAVDWEIIKFLCSLPNINTAKPQSGPLPNSCASKCFQKE